MKSFVYRRNQFNKEAIGRLGQHDRLQPDRPPGARLSPLIDRCDKLLPLEIANRCGLIVNELVTCCLTFSFTAGKAGNLFITAMETGEGKARLDAADNGAGSPPGLDIEITSTPGLRLISSLADQLDGAMKIDNHNGTALFVYFPTVQMER